MRKYPSGYVITLSYTINKKRKYLSTNHNLKSDRLWDQKNQLVRETHPDHENINKDLAARKQRFITPILEAQVKGGPIHLDRDFYAFVEGWIKEVAPNRSQQTISNYEKHLRKLKAFAPSLSFEEITPEFLSRYEAYIRGKGTASRKTNSSYITAIWRTLKKWFNVARKRGLTSNYPFDHYENPKYNPDEKDYLTLAELDKWEKYARTAKGENKQVAVYFLLGCYSGLRISDWYKFNKKSIHNSEIRLRAQKNGQWVSIPIHKRLKRVLDMLETLTVAEPTLNKKLKTIAKELKIDKVLSSHSGRKCFAVTMCAEQGISSETCAELMGITISVCVNSYYRVTPEKIKNETLKAWRQL